MRTILTIGVTRSFSVGFTIHSPKLNGLSIELRLACFIFRVSSKGKKLIKFCNWWNG